MGYEAPDDGGYEVEETVARLVFPDRDGLEVVCALPSLDELFSAAELAAVDPEKLRAEDYARLNQVIDMFANAVRSWNLTRNGEPIPATPDGVRSLEMTFRIELINAWMSAAAEAVAQKSKQQAPELDPAAIEAELPAETL